MRAGKRLHRVWVDEPVPTQDPSGDLVEAWVARGQMRCSIEPVSGREALRAGQVLAEMDTRITALWSLFTSQIKANWRFRFERNGTDPIIYNIARPPAEKNMAMREIEFMCGSGLNNG